MTVHRVWTSSFGRVRLVGRAIDYTSFFLTAAGQLARVMRPGDIVVTKTDPPLLSLVTTPLCALRGAKSVNWLQDIFPEVAERLGVGRGRLARLGCGVLRKLRDASLRAAHKNAVLGAVMQRDVERLNVPASRIVQIPNWADGQPSSRLHEARTRSGPTGVWMARSSSPTPATSAAPMTPRPFWPP